MGIKKAIINRVTHPKKYNYHIWRGILELLYMNRKNRKLTKDYVSYMGIWAAGKIANAGKEKSEGYWRAVEQIIDIFYIDDTLYIYTRTPGTLIGRPAETIDDLEKFLGVKHIYLIETPLNEATTSLRSSYRAAIADIDYI